MADLRVLYIRKLPSINGRTSLAGRKLYDAFREQAAECLLGHYVCDEGEEFAAVDPRWADDFVSQDELGELRPNLVYIEGGLLYDESRWKLPRPVAERLLADGTVLVVSDVDRNEFSWHKAQYKDAGTLFHTAADYGPGESISPVYGVDEASSWKGALVCDPTKMTIADWLQPIYEGVSEVCVAGSVSLAGFAQILATGNQGTSGTLRNDVWVDRVDAFPWASVAGVGRGYAVLIAGAVSSDYLLQRCPDNTRWLLQIGQHLVDEAEAERARAASAIRSPFELFLSYRTSDNAVVDVVASEIKRMGIGIWHDSDQLVPSDSLVAAIDRGLSRMSHYVLFWSERCVGAPWVARELQVGVTRLVEHSVPVLIVRLDDTPPPSIVSDLYRIEAQQMAAPEIAGAIVHAVRRLAKRQGGPAPPQ